MIGLPLLNGFVGEFLILSSTFTGVSRGWAIAATVAVILGAAYMLWLVQRLFYGPESEMAATKPASDLELRRMQSCGTVGRADAGDGRRAITLAARPSRKLALRPASDSPARSTRNDRHARLRVQRFDPSGGTAMNPFPDILRILPESSSRSPASW